MTTLTVLPALVALVLLMIRPLDAQARTPAELRAAVQHAGWARTGARTVQVAAVVLLLLLAVVCRICWHTAWAVGTVVAALAVGVAALGAGPQLGQAGGQA